MFSLGFLGLTMKRVLLVTATVWALVSPAFAGELPIFNWSGFYVGGTAGYAHSVNRQNGFTPPNSINNTNNIDGNGFIGGGTVGYNLQSGNYVGGFEADWSYARLEGRAFGRTGTINCGPVACVDKLDDLITARLRVGYITGAWLTYFTAGYAASRMSANDSGFSLNEAWRNGWTVGSGVELAIGPNWSTKFEYLHVGLQDSETFIVTGTHLKANGRIDLFRAGINYRFGSL